MKSDVFRVACVSDIHLGNPKNKTQYITSNLEKAFPDNAETAKLDMIVIAGDLYDRLLSQDEEDVIYADVWLFSLLKICKRHDICLRVLEGTPSHDCKQSRRIVVLNESSGINCDLQYVDTLSIEYNTKFGFNFLYVPDEWTESPEETLYQVKQLMCDRGLDKVDYAFMHGCFDYQLPAISNDHKHDSKTYLELVRYLIFIGHVHVFSKYDRIIAQGSFDRLSHNEEGRKGHVRVSVKPDGEYKLDFIINENARKFITIKCLNDNIDDSLRLITDVVNDVEDGSFVRISCSPNNPIIHEMPQLMLMRPLITWTKKVIDGDDGDDYNINQSDSDLNIRPDEFKPITITKDNIQSLMIDRLVSRGINGNLLDIASQCIEEIINA